MELYSKGRNYKLYNGDMFDMLSELKPQSIDAIVTDPPYEINFMGKSWDNAGISFQKSTWERCFDVLKPGGHMLVFGGARTFHRIACAIEDAGFEIRDTIMYMFGSGFPKSLDISKQIDKQNMNLAKKWQGWGTQIKPAYEPIIVARKPCEGTVTENTLKYGVGGINIDECRIPFENTPNPATNPLYRLQAGYKTTAKTVDELGVTSFGTSKNDTSPLGRFPSNVILTYDDTDFDEVCGGFPNTKSTQATGVKRNARTDGNVFDNSNCGFRNENYDENRVEGFNDSGSAARYFYCAKASKRDRDEGLDYLPIVNDHPTVKPVSLMQYLIRLVAPKGAVVLDPFTGSGSTGKAVMYENADRDAEYRFIGIELDNHYCEIANARISYAEGSPVMLPVEEQVSTSNVSVGLFEL